MSTAISFKNVDFSKFKVGEEEKSKSGNIYRKIEYCNTQFQNIQLSENVFTALRCQYGVESASQTNPDKLCIKLDVDNNVASFIKKLDEMIINAVNDPTFKHISILKENESGSSIKLKIQDDTRVLITNLKGNNITQPVQGKLGDIKRGSMVVPIVKIQSGVYFISDDNGDKKFGTSIVATDILVVNHSNETSFDFGAMIVD